MSRDGASPTGALAISTRARASIMRPCFVYIISLRTETGFHENAVERVALDIDETLQTGEARRDGRFLRRGGVDINRIRSIRFGAATGLAQALRARPIVNTTGDPGHRK